MSDWTGGYVSDVEYLPGLYGEQAPGIMDLGCLMSGVEPARRPGSNAAFAYCDLGCGQASTVAALAAANPEARFWGVDFMPAHIARAEAFRQAAEIGNLTLIEADVAVLARADDPGLPQFDYVALHGLFSWVSDAVRAGIVAFLDRFLKPGGLVYVGYNVMPGWTDALPMQKVLIEYAATRPGPSSSRVAEAAEFAMRMHAAGARTLGTELHEKLFPDIRIPEFMQRHYRYMAHEFLNTNWQPRFHIDVVRELAPAKLEFVGSASLLENFSGVGLSDEAQAILQTVPEGPLRETFNDYFNVRRFRRDIFVRGRREISRELREAMLANVVLAMVGPRPAPDQSSWPQLSIRFELNRTTYDPVFDRLERGPAAVAELCAAVEGAGGRVSGNELVGMLVGLDLVQPVLHDVPGAVVESCWRHNRVVAHEAFRSVRQNVFSLAVPVGHTGTMLNAFQTLMLDGLFAGVPAEVEALTGYVLARLDLDPETVQKPSEPETTIGGAPAGSDGGGDAATVLPPKPRPVGEVVHDAAVVVVEQLLPIWRQLGLLPPRAQD
jgi:ubiquinone/menaquinone biosynthesis C-methylase UbiE